ncbi:non-ribosomal peptide synthetase [Micromonospora coxensis]|uniref:Amino acid adenylation domain-containing protein n=1 Tax=Micromonospora coxensis TaxID=356852 RepID=A0A1C5K120_9ACTN|nr:non-ribosomal peptide synthetase [Micromonospora coxensis]SCG75996.1 amino acid adenylation domain-containing protein [Micromonospora coxensis]
MNTSDPYGAPATAAESGIWFTERMGGLGTVYSMPFAITFDGPLDDAALAGAIRQVVARHPVLAAAFVERDGLPVRVAAATPPLLTTVDLRFDPGHAPAVERAEIERPFDLARGPLLRCTLIRLAPQRARLLVVAHHLVFDGQSTSIFVDDLAAAYAGEVLPTLDTAPDEGPAELLPGAKRFWARHHTGGTDVVLPGLRGTPGTAGPGEAVTFDLDDSLWAAIRATSRRLGHTTFVITLASWLLLLRRYGNETPVIGVDLGTRSPAQRHHIGAHVNELPVALAARRGETFEDVTTRLVAEFGLRSDADGLYRYRQVPLARAVGAVRPAVALAPVTLGYRRREAAAKFPGLDTVVDWALPNHTSRGALRIHIVDGPEQRRVSLQFDPGVVSRDDVERVARDWRELLRAVAEHPDTPWHDLPFTGREQSPAGEAAISAPPVTLPQLLAEQIGRTPDAVAVEHGPVSLTYAQLGAAIDALAQRLRDAGIGAGALVALLARRGVDALVAQLAVLRSGAAYLPLDPDHPSARNTRILADARPDLVLTSHECTSVLPAVDGAPILLWDSGSSPAGGFTPGRPAHPGECAYVLYTSGSTGQPKGVQVEHRSLANLLRDFRDRLGSGPGHRWLALTALTFDIAALELYLPLISGGTVVIAPPEVARDGHQIARLVADRGVTHVQATPSGWQLMLDGGLAVDGITALTGGEALTEPLAQRLAGRAARLLNVYGPTETTIWSTVAELPDAGQGAIGRPIAHTTVHVLDEWGDPVPPGLLGELWIGGVGLARGYLGRPGLTADRFRPDPFGPPGARLYRTGDLVRRRDDGVLEFAGRRDEQVKLRGHRIELGEIEARLLEHPQVARAAVVSVGEAGEQRLVAYVVPTATPPSPHSLREHLAGALPAIMVPAVIALIDALPLNTSGKIDRVALRARPVVAANPDAGVPQGDTPTAAGPVREIQQIWSDVLGTTAIGIHDDLFDLGGHSLTVAQISARIRARLGVELPLHVMYDRPTIAGMAEEVAGALRGTRL